MNIFRFATSLKLGIVFIVVAAGFYFWVEHIEQPSSETHNLILNPSLELATSEGKQPRFWRQGSYGEHDTVFRYPVEGRAGGKAAHIEMVNHQSGDAKWIFNDIAVVPGETYTFSNYYRANVPTKIFVRYNTGNCLTAEVDCDFEALRVLPAASEWKPATVSFRVPDKVVSVTLFQSLATDGWLTVDSFSLVSEKSDLHIALHRVPNPSLTKAALTHGLPEAWQPNGYGENERKFEYLTNDGFTDQKSVKVTMSNYVSGDAKWMYEPQPIESGKDYHFSVVYKTNVVPHVVVQFIDGAGQISYLGLPKAFPSSSDWHRYDQEFSVPEGAVLASAFMFIAEDGWLQTDDYKIEPYEYHGFARPIVTLTFDDGAKTNTQTALSIMDAHGFKSTQCYMTGPSVGDDENITNIHLFKNHGHEICSHSITHPDLTTVSPAELTAELTESRKVLEQIINAPVPNFATPYGAYDPTVLTEVQKYYSVHRTVDEGYNSPDNLDFYKLKVQNMKPDTTLAQFQEWVDKAMRDKTWLILVYHRVDANNLGAFDTHVDDFAAQMEYLASTGVTVKRLDEAVEEVRSQVNQPR